MCTFQDVLQQVEIINKAVNFLEVLKSVNASRLKKGGMELIIHIRDTIGNTLFLI